MKNQTGGKIQLVRPNQSSSECIGGGNPIKTAEDVCGPCVGIFFANYGYPKDTKYFQINPT